MRPEDLEQVETLRILAASGGYEGDGFTDKPLDFTSGKHTKNYGQPPSFSWVNQRTKWAMFNSKL